MNNLIFLAILLCLTSCQTDEYHGHYKVDVNKIYKGMPIEKLKEKLGAPLKIFSINNILYYVYSHYILYPHGYRKNVEAVIIRIEKENNLVKTFDVIKFQDFETDKEKSKKPLMNINIINEIITNIGNIKGMENIDIKNSDNKEKKLDKSNEIVMMEK